MSKLTYLMSFPCQGQSLKLIVNFETQKILDLAENCMFDFLIGQFNTALKNKYGNNYYIDDEGIEIISRTPSNVNVDVFVKEN